MFYLQKHAIGKSKISLFGDELPLYDTIPSLTTLNQRAFENIGEKEKMLVTSIFSFFHNVFYPLKERNHHFSDIKFVVCNCFQFGQGQNFVV